MDLVDITFTEYDVIEIILEKPSESADIRQGSSLRAFLVYKLNSMTMLDFYPQKAENQL